MLKSLLVSLGVLAIIGFTPAIAQESPAGRMVTTADGSSVPRKPRSYRKKRPALEVNIYSTRRRGGYSFGVSEVTGTYSSRNPPPYAHVRQTPSGPFDSGFFFDSGFGLHGGDAPYAR